MPQPSLKPLDLLRQVRQIMSGAESAQHRLDELTRTIATHFGCEVCSIYLQRAGEVLELFANFGLNPDAVHFTRLSGNEGLVGEVARLGQVLNLPEASQHPQFSYRPETGEEKVRSFLGVPILSADKVVGVLVVQSSQPRIFQDDALETLQTIAMVLAELQASGKLVNLRELREGSSTGITSEHVSGLRFAPGLARAPALIHQTQAPIRRVIAENPAEEIQRLHQALAALQASIDELIAAQGFRSGDTQGDIMEAYRLFSQDEGWIRQLTEAIESGLSAEAAVHRVQEQLHQRMSTVSSHYIRERMQDLDDLSHRLQRHLTGHAEAPELKKLPPKFILIAKRIGPAELLEYGRRRIKGIVLEEGAATAHIVIIARAMGVPVVGRVAHATQLIRKGDAVIVDGDHGEVYIRPHDDITRSIGEHLLLKRQQEEDFAKLHDLPAETTDGVRISLNLNTGLFLDPKQLRERDVDGIGLYRTELPYMVSRQLPSVQSQIHTYKKILRQAGAGKRVTFRTFDIGGDKPLPYFPMGDEQNPAMGWRATRIGLDRPGIFRKQCRALLIAAAGRDLRVMFPFIAMVSEFKQARQLLRMELRQLQDEGKPVPARIQLGVMLEIPSLLWQLPQLLPEVDFVSVGSNDLLQFLFASDRGSQNMHERYDPLSPVVLSVLQSVVDACQTHGTELQFCGDMARNPLEAMALIGLGFRSFSVPPPSVGPLKAMIRSLDTRLLTEYLHDLQDSSAASIRHELQAFAKDHTIQL